MGNYIIVRTWVDNPDVQMWQGDEGELRRLLAVAPEGREKIIRVFNFTPSPEQKETVIGATRLGQPFLVHTRSAAEQCLREALYYAKIDGNRTESLVLGGFLQQVMLAYKAAQALEARVAAPAKPEELPCTPDGDCCMKAHQTNKPPFTCSCECHNQPIEESTHENSNS